MVRRALAHLNVVRTAARGQRQDILWEVSMRSRQALLTNAMTMPSPSQPVLAFALALALSGPAWAQEAVNTDIGTLDKATAEKVFPAKRPYSPYAGRNFPTRPLFGDTHVHTACRLTPARSARGSVRATPTVSPRARRSWPRPDNSRNFRGRSTSWSSPITPTIWASSRIS